MTRNEFLGKGTLYDILGLSPTSTRQEIKSQFYKLSLLYHPDRNPVLDRQDSRWHRDKFVEITNAYSILGNDQERVKYDRELDLTSAIHLNNHNKQRGRSFWDPYPGFRHTMNQQRNRAAQERMRTEAMNHRARWWKEEPSLSDLKRIKEAQIQSEAEQWEAKSLKRNRFLLVVFIIGVYLLSNR